MNMILNEKEISSLVSMGEYWNEVKNRTNIMPLKSELRAVVVMLETKILWIVLEYIRLKRIELGDTQ